MLLFKKKFMAAVRSGEKTQTLRLWPYRRMRPGQRSYIPGIGYIAVDAVDETTLDALTDDDARLDGFPTATGALRRVRESLSRPNRRREPDLPRSLSRAQSRRTSSLPGGEGAAQTGGENVLMLFFVAEVAKTSESDATTPTTARVFVAGAASFERSPNRRQAQRFAPDRHLPNVIGRVTDHHLRERVADGRKDVAERFLRQWPIEVFVAELLDGLDEPHLGVAEHCQRLLFRDVGTRVRVRRNCLAHTASPNRAGNQEGTPTTAASSWQEKIKWPTSHEE